MVELLAPDAVRALQAAPLTYAEVGATARTSPLPAGYHHQQVSAQVGTGAAQFEAATETLMTWGMHERAGLRAQVSDLRVRPGSVAVLLLGLGPVALRVPVRVLEVVEEERRRGFVYGTLPGHPARGEESFLLELARDGAVSFAVVAFSRPARWFTRLGAPLARAAQYLMAERYVSAVREAAQAAGTG